MNNNMIYVTSASDHTLVINRPEIPLNKVWRKRGQKLPIDREQLTMAFYTLGVETLFRQGKLVTDDEIFLKDVGLMDEDGVKAVEPVSEETMKRMISVMPVSDFKVHLNKMTESQKQEFATYAVEHYKELKNDRIDLISKAVHKDIFKTIVNYKESQEE